MAVGATGNRERWFSEAEKLTGKVKFRPGVSILGGEENEEWSELKIWDQRILGLK